MQKALGQPDWEGHLNTSFLPAIFYSLLFLSWVAKDAPEHIPLGCPKCSKGTINNDCDDQETEALANLCQRTPAEPQQLEGFSFPLLQGWYFKVFLFLFNQCTWPALEGAEPRERGSAATVSVQSISTCK